MPHTSHGQPFAANSDTSYEAAIRSRKFVSRQGLCVFRWLKKRGGFGGTQREAQEHLQISRQSLCARFKALQDAGAIRPLRGTSRARCTVYQVTGPMPAQLGLEM